jgi:hypothetical protein
MWVSITDRNMPWGYRCTCGRRHHVGYMSAGARLVSCACGRTVDVDKSMIIDDKTPVKQPITRSEGGIA